MVTALFSPLFTPEVRVIIIISSIFVILIEYLFTTIGVSPPLSACANEHLTDNAQ